MWRREGSGCIYGWGGSLEFEVVLWILGVRGGSSGDMVVRIFVVFGVGIG